MKPYDAKGFIFQIQRWSVHDGDGIRSTVFFKGCPLRCQWCANPESWRQQVELFFFPDRCSGCGRCLAACPAGASKLVTGKSEVARSKCLGCGNCAAQCPTAARRMIGSGVTVQEVLRLIKRDAVFYRESGGGITFSGGEPFAQPELLRQLVQGCQDMGIETAVETSGCFELEAVEDIFGQLDCVFMDIKHMDDGTHMRLTGVSNRTILDNVAAVARLHSKVIVRVPLIQGINDKEENIAALCSFLQANPQIAGVELLSYHGLGEGKYAALGMAGTSFAPPSRESVERIKAAVANQGITVLDYS